MKFIRVNMNEKAVSVEEVAAGLPGARRQGICAPLRQDWANHPESPLILFPPSPHSREHTS